MTTSDPLPPDAPDPREEAEEGDPDAETAASENEDGLDPDETGPTEPPPPRPTFLGEIVQRRSWPLLAIVFVFGLFLAAVPFLFQSERSPFADALTLYDRLCKARPTPAPADLSAAARALTAASLAEGLAALPCVDRADFRPRMDPVEGRQFGANRAFVVTLERRPEAPESRDPTTVRFLVEEEAGVVRWSPWPAGIP